MLSDEQIANRRAELAEASGQVQMLIEALPWLKDATGKTVVIKYGGAAMTDENMRAKVMSDIVLMKIIGINPIIVHGGGNDITTLSKQLGYTVDFEDGMRVTPPEVMDLVKMVLVGKVNQGLVSQLNTHGHLAVGLNGADGHIVLAQQYKERLGQVGIITKIDTTLLVDLITADYIPVIASVAVGEDGESFNVNADLVAGAIAAAIGAHKVLFLTDVDGLYENFEDKASLISRLTLSEAREIVAKGDLAKGMIPKIDACIDALTAGVPRAHILNGTRPHAMLLELFTDSGIGTMLVNDVHELDGLPFETYPLDNLASKLY